MSARSSIEWTDATWNPVRGCTRVSPGCENCYAERMAARFSDEGQWGRGYAERTPSGPRWTRKIDLVFSALNLPLHWLTPRRIFVNSTSDLFHEGLSDAQIDEVTFIIAKCAATPPFDRHVFQVLTKRARRMRDYWGAIIAGRLVLEHIRLDAPLPNLWLGVSVENQEYVDERVPALIQTPAAVRFLSCEPLLGPIDLGRWIEPIDWVICGGESGPGARPMHPDWARSLRDQCAAAKVPFFLKQWGEWIDADTWFAQMKTTIFFDGQPWHPALPLNFDDAALLAGVCNIAKVEHRSSGETFLRVGKGRAGRLLDHRFHSEFPR